MFNKNIIIYSNIIAVIVGGLGSYFISKNSFSPSKNTPSSAVMASANSDTYHQARVNDHPFIKPLLYAEQESESPHYNDLKNDIHDIIVDFESQHKITSASIYFRDLSKAEWIENNPQYSYSMGSLGKLPLLFTYLHQAEVQPELLNKKVFSGKQPKDLLVDRSIAKNMIEEDHTYTVRQLLEAMTANEDNYATYLLNLNADTNLYRKTYTELGIGSPDMKNPDFEISSKNYSRFLLVLYNASYLSYAMSDYASS